MQTHMKGEHYVNMKLRIRVMLLYAKKHQTLPANYQKLGERHRTDSPSQPSDETNTLISDFHLQKYETISFCCLSYPAHGTCHISPSKLTQTALPKSLRGMGHQQHWCHSNREDTKKSQCPPNCATNQIKLWHLTGFLSSAVVLEEPKETTELASTMDVWETQKNPRRRTSEQNEKEKLRLPSVQECM